MQVIVFFDKIWKCIDFFLSENMDNSQENTFDGVCFSKVASLRILKFYYKQTNIVFLKKIF